METRNDISTIQQAGIPAALGEFSCGYWGKHQPPYIQENQIVIDVGQGYRSNKHLHGQNLYVIEADAEQRVALIEMRKYGDLYGAGLWHYLIGVDNVPFIQQRGQAGVRGPAERRFKDGTQNQPLQKARQAASLRASARTRPDLHARPGCTYRPG